MSSLKTSESDPMTLAQIYRLALRQLDEDPEDISEFKELFEAYVNEGYRIAVNDYWKPRFTFNFTTDDNGNIDIHGMHIRSLVSVKSDNYNIELHAAMSEDMNGIHVYGGIAGANQPVTVIARVEMPPLKADTDVPKIPEEAHMALVDYICYRYKSSGNLAKQSQAQAYLSLFQTTLMRMPSMAEGSAIHQKNLYLSTSLGWPW